MKTPDQISFNKRMDELIQNVLSQNLLTPEFRAEYVKAMNLYRRVAEYDTQLAWDILDSTFMYCCTFSLGIIEKFGKK